MVIIKILSGVVIFSFCLFLFGLAIMIVFKPQSAERFLSSYASSARAHYTEQIGRLVVGAALVIYAPAMRYPNILTVFGWILVITAIGLMLTPWQWHHKFGEIVIPLTIQFKNLYAVGALLLGIFVLYSLSRLLVT